jgi:hypothetical protein
MDSDVTVRIPIKILPKVCYRFLEYPAGNVAINDGLDLETNDREGIARQGICRCFPLLEAGGIGYR